MKNIIYYFLILLYTLGNTLNANAKSNEWGGSGFALLDGYIVTNYHVIKDANVICIQQNNNLVGFAEVYAVDKEHDLAILKMLKYSVLEWPITLPYRINTQIEKIGSDVFTLGYPLTDVMGNSLKLSTGVISSINGYKDDKNEYQISTPIQPGNSGGPLFDKNGSIIGVVNAKLLGGENVAYAIKASCLYDLIHGITSSSLIPDSTFAMNLPLSEMVDILKDCIFNICCYRSYHAYNPMAKPNKEKSNCIYYTTTNEKIVKPSFSKHHILSNTYNNGQGVMIFSEPVGLIEPLSFNKKHTITSVTLPDIAIIGYNAFFDCKNLKIVDFFDNAGALLIGNQAFANCANLQTIKLSKTKLIGDEVFANCKKIANIKLPTSLDFIGIGAFYGCCALESITIPPNVQHIGFRAFMECSQLKTIYCKPQVPPAIGYETYENVHGSFPLYGIKIYVPKSAYDTYLQYKRLANYEVAPENWSKYKYSIYPDDM